MYPFRHLALLLLFLPVFAAAQSTWVKGYVVAGQGPRYVLESNPRGIFIVNRTKFAVHWVAALERQEKSGNLLEVGLHVFGRQKSQYPVTVILPPNFVAETIDAGTTKSFGLDLNLEYSLLLFDDLGAGLNGYLGFALNSGYAQFKLNSHQSSVFSANEHQYWGNLGVVPRLQMGLGKRLKLDFNAALFLLGASHEASRTKNPALTLSQQKSTLLSINLLQKAWLRLGLGYRLGKDKVDKTD
jgi:hypothetical protein